MHFGFVCYQIGRDNPTVCPFTADGWFRTGDIAEEEPEGTYKILGRASVDIIKTGGYKISAIDIERELLEHPEIREVAIVGYLDKNEK